MLGDSIIRWTARLFARALLAKPREGQLQEPCSARPEGWARVRRRGTRLRTQLVAATMFVALVPLLVLTISFLLFESRTEESSARSRVDETARSIASSIDSFLRSHLASLASLATDWTLLVHSGQSIADREYSFVALQLGAGMGAC